MDFMEDSNFSLDYVKNNSELNKKNLNDLIKIIHINDLHNINYFTNFHNECSICLGSFESKKKNYKFLKKNTNLNNEKKCFCLKFFECCNLFSNNNNINQNIYNLNSNNICILSCYHIFHTNCILTWLKKEKSCPLCRTKLQIIK